jgi:hypothetical protein
VVVVVPVEIIAAVVVKADVNLQPVNDTLPSRVINPTFVLVPLNVHLEKAAKADGEVV